MLDTDAFSDQEIVAKTLDGEAGNQGYEGQQAVANVIMNRVKLNWQGETTLRGVCLHRKQFSCWNPGFCRDRIMKYLDPQCLQIARDLILDHLPDITHEADSYEVTGTNAYWTLGLVPCAVIRKHSFYRTRKS
jgi:spore germination cell wall hydrolase CwlJ-like protein